MTIEEFDRLPDPPGIYWELRNGEAVQVTYPNQQHANVQDRLFQLLSEYSQGPGKVRACAVRRILSCPTAKTVTVYTVDGGRRVYKPGESIPLARFFAAESAILVNDIFTGPET